VGLHVAAAVADGQVVVNLVADDCVVPLDVSAVVIACPNVAADNPGLLVGKVAPGKAVVVAGVVLPSLVRVTLMLPIVAAQAVVVVPDTGVDIVMFPCTLHSQLVEVQMQLGLAFRSVSVDCAAAKATQRPAGLYCSSQCSLPKWIVSPSI
jgi:hypothetical protein